MRPVCSVEDKELAQESGSVVLVLLSGEGSYSPQHSDSHFVRADSAKHENRQEGREKALFHLTIENLEIRGRLTVVADSEI